MIRALGNIEWSPSGSLSQLKLLCVSGSGREAVFVELVVLERALSPSRLLLGMYDQHSTGLVPKPGMASMLLQLVLSSCESKQQHTRYLHVEGPEMFVCLGLASDTFGFALTLFPRTQLTLLQRRMAVLARDE